MVATITEAQELLGEELALCYDIEHSVNESDRLCDLRANLERDLRDVELNFYQERDARKDMFAELANDFGVESMQRLRGELAC